MPPIKQQFTHFHCRSRSNLDILVFNHHERNSKSELRVKFYQLSLAHVLWVPRCVLGSIRVSWGRKKRRTGHCGPQGRIFHRCLLVGGHPHRTQTHNPPRNMCHTSARNYRQAFLYLCMYTVRMTDSQSTIWRTFREALKYLIYLSYVLREELENWKCIKKFLIFNISMQNKVCVWCQDALDERSANFHPLNWFFEKTG